MIGVWPENLRDGSGRENVLPLVRCPGRGNHPKPLETCTENHWGVVEEFYYSYRETNTRERAYRYVGLPWWPLLIVVLAVIVRKNHGEHFKKIRVGEKFVLWLPRRKVFWKKIRKIFSDKNLSWDRPAK